jgi:hypothetical protein
MACLVAGHATVKATQKARGSARKFQSYLLLLAALVSVCILEVISDGEPEHSVFVLLLAPTDALRLCGPPFPVPISHLSCASFFFFHLRTHYKCKWKEDQGARVGDLFTFCLFLTRRKRADSYYCWKLSWGDGFQLPRRKLHLEDPHPRRFKCQRSNDLRGLSASVRERSGLFCLRP